MAANIQSQVVDFAYLEGFAAGDVAVVSEVLALFCEQAEAWMAALEPANPEWRNVVHTIKGAARGVGARPLGDVCEAAELDGAHELPAVRASLADTVAAIADYRAKG